jgi:hypothetical protein
MGYAQALLARDVGREREELESKAKKKSLWGSIGRTVGSLGVMAITGGAVNPVTLGLLTGGASFLGGAIGAKAAGGKLTGGKFFKSDREELQDELGAFGSGNITASLKSGIQAGIGQAAKLQKAKLFDKPIVATPTTREGLLKSMDFEGSMVGKGLEKVGAARATKQLAKARNLQVGEGLVPSIGDSTGVGTGTLPTGKSDIPSLSDLYQEEVELSRFKLPEGNEAPWQESLFGGVDPKPKGRQFSQLLRDFGRQYLTPGRGLAVDEAGEVITDAQRWPGGYQPVIK